MLGFTIELMYWDLSTHGQNFDTQDLCAQQ